MMIVKKILLSFVFISTILSLIIACENKKEFKSTPTSSYLESAAINAIDLKTNSSGLSDLKAIIKTVHGNITVKFYSSKAPSTVTRIIQLIQNGFYDGLTFHRILPNYVIQTGDPTGSGTGGSDIKLKPEFNDIQHIKGTVAMARKVDDINSADSQFYIALTTLPHLDGKYTVFGQVVDGMNLLEKIQKDDKILSIVISN